MKRYTPPNVYRGTVSNSWYTEAISVSIDSQMEKGDVILIYKGYYTAIKKEWNNAICSNMDEPRYYHTKWSKPERET